MTAKLHQVHIRVNDAATGKPTPCRVRFTDGEGTYYPPHGRLAKFAAGPNQDVGGNVYVGLKPHAYIDGTSEILLPAGPLHVSIDKGPEYKPVRADVQLAAGKLSLRFELERWIDLRAEGWYSGDTRATFLSPHAALLEGQAEDLAVVNLLATETTLKDAFGETVRAVPNLLAFSGQDFALSVPGHGVAVNTLNRHPLLGTLGLLHCHRVVFPLAFGGPDGLDDWTLSDWCDQCHRKSGLVIWAEAAHRRPECGYGEALADLALGKVDAFELDHFDASPFDGFADWTWLLNAGLKATVVGASGKNSNGRVLGAMRTYAHLLPGQPFGYKSWIEAVRAGRTFVTNGPLISLSVNGAEPSTTPIKVGCGENVHVRAEARSWLPFDELNVSWCGQTPRTTQPSAAPPYHAVLEFTHPMGDMGHVWVGASCTGETQLPDRPARQRVFACTSPVYLRCDERSVVPQAYLRLGKELADAVNGFTPLARSDFKTMQRLTAIFNEASQLRYAHAFHAPHERPT